MRTPLPCLRLFVMSAIALALACLTACQSQDNTLIQGYVEGEYVYVSPQLGGEITSVAVRQGQQVAQGDLLFTLDDAPEIAALEEAEERITQGLALLQDARKGQRPTELASLEAQLKQAAAALVLAEKTLERQQTLFASNAIAMEDLDQARTAAQQNRQRVSQLQADLETAQLGNRPGQIEAAEANVQALEAELAQAEWNLAQKQQSAPQAALIFDTLLREGEYAAAGRPVVSLLPPENIIVRAFVPETMLGALQVGDPAAVQVDGAETPFHGDISFISPEAEFTPPVIYSKDVRDKFVFMVEISFPPDTASKLHPGQPADVRFGAEHD